MADPVTLAAVGIGAASVISSVINANSTNEAAEAAAAARKQLGDETFNNLMQNLHDPEFVTRLNLPAPKLLKLRKFVESPEVIAASGNAGVSETSRITDEISRLDNEIADEKNPQLNAELQVERGKARANLVAMTKKVLGRNGGSNDEALADLSVLQNTAVNDENQLLEANARNEARREGLKSVRRSLIQGERNRKDSLEKGVVDAQNDTNTRAFNNKNAFESDSADLENKDIIRSEANTATNMQIQYENMLDARKQRQMREDDKKSAYLSKVGFQKDNLAANQQVDNQRIAGNAGIASAAIGAASEINANVATKQAQASKYEREDAVAKTKFEQDLQLAKLLGKK